jgi:ribosome-binding factor A
MSPSRYRRTDRVAALILREVTRIVREEVRDPRIGFVTFTGADVSPDLAAGRVFVSVMGTEGEKRESLAGLQSAAPFIRSQLWQILDLKMVPDLTFELDRTLERAARIDALLEQIRETEGHGERGNEADGEAGADLGQAAGENLGRRADDDPAGAEEPPPARGARSEDAQGPDQAG